LAILSVYVSPSFPLEEAEAEESRALEAAGRPRAERRESISREEDVRSIVEILRMQRTI
jgi:hypothetical protein